MSKHVLCLDFDGVIHQQKEGHKGMLVISERPVDGVFQFLEHAVKVFEVNIYSGRSGYPGGIEAMRDWLQLEAVRAHVDGKILFPDWLNQIVWPTRKPATYVGLDDRVVTFTGVFPLIEDLLAFETWEKSKF